jgi:hypothetical protein
MYISVSAVVIIRCIRDERTRWMKGEFDWASDN